MAKLIQIHFDFSGPFGAQMAAQLKDLAESINQEPGFIWKVWTEDAQRQLAGGVYLFEDDKSARAYVSKHTARLQAMGVNEVVCELFDVNEPLTAINHGITQRP
jgi:hypothetical protein